MDQRIAAGLREQQIVAQPERFERSAGIDDLERFAVRGEPVREFRVNVREQRAPVGGESGRHVVHRQGGDPVHMAAILKNWSGSDEVLERAASSRKAIRSIVRGRPRERVTDARDACSRTLVTRKRMHDRRDHRKRKPLQPLAISLHHEPPRPLGISLTPPMIDRPEREPRHAGQVVMDRVIVVVQKKQPPEPSRFVDDGALRRIGDARCSWNERTAPSASAG